MNITKQDVKVALSALVLSTASVAGLNAYVNHNKTYEYEGVVHYRKMDSIIGHTHIRVQETGDISVEQTKILGAHTYTQETNPQLFREQIQRFAPLMQENTEYITLK